MDDSQSPPRPLVKMRLTRERYPHPYKECFVPSPTDAGLTFHPPRGAQRPRWRTDPGSGSDIICNSPDFSLAKYCSLCGFHAQPHSFAVDKSRDDSQSPHVHLSKPVLLGRGSGSDTICNSPNLLLVRYCPLCGFHAPPNGFAFGKSRDDSQSPHAHLSKHVLLGT
ncbi:hypothetical protein PIB30_092463, partial [Stylosanthes scabra]|nr:hypothetical protein [Stylosanthes scabra]